MGKENEKKKKKKKKMRLVGLEPNDLVDVPGLESHALPTAPQPLVVE